MLKKQTGVTIVVLTITIVVLLILAAVSINVAVNGGLFSSAGNAKNKIEEMAEMGQNLANEPIVVANTLYESAYDYAKNIPSRLPIEYKEVEYLQSTGTQYIKINDNTKYPYWKIDFKMEEIPANTYLGVFGRMYVTSEANQTGSRAFALLIKGNGYFAYRHTYYNGTIPNLFVSDTNRHSIYCTNNRIIVDNNNTYTVSSKTNDSASINNFNIFALAEPSGSGHYKSKMKLYSLKLYNNLANYNSDTPTYDFVPCYRKDDLKPGLYDMVAGGFYTNSGTGDFTYPNSN